MVDRYTAVLDTVFAAVSDRTRRRFVARLSRGEATISELAAPLDMSLQNASKHVRVLEDAGLVNRRKRGREQVVRLNAKPLAAAAGWLEDYRAFWNDALDRLAEHVEKPKAKEKR